MKAAGERKTIPTKVTDAGWRDNGPNGELQGGPSHLGGSHRVACEAWAQGSTDPRGVLRAPPADAAYPGSIPEPAETKGGSPVMSGGSAGHWPAFSPEDLRRAQAGDEEALGRFFDHHFDRIFAVVLRFEGIRDIAEDITQDIFLKVRRHIARLDIQRDPAPWLYTVTVNACRDHHRSAWRRIWRRSVRVDAAPELPDLASEADDPQLAFITAEDEQRVQVAVRQLPLDLRMSVILHDFEGLPHDQIAQVTGTSHAAARKRHSRALRSLAVLLAEDATR